jgi:predicted Holliday junction resolvase-like endonuclease
MKKAFEFFLVLIIFYGVYSAFDDALLYVFPELKTFWIVVISLLVAAALLLLYSQIIIGSTKRKIKEKMTKVVSDLESKVHEKEEEVKQKDSELKDAFKIRKAVEEEVEDTL